MVAGACASARELDWLLRVRARPGVQRKYLSWLDNSSLSPDTWAVALYALVCVVMSKRMLSQPAGTDGVPPTTWLLLGLAFRLAVCIGFLALQRFRQPLYLRWRTQLLIGVQLACHFSGLLLEAPATFWIQPAKGKAGFLLPIVGQVFETLGFRISFQWHLVRALLDLTGSFLATRLNVNWGWAMSLNDRTALTKHWELMFFLQYILSGLGLITVMMYFVERRAVLSFLSRNDYGTRNNSSDSDDEDGGNDVTQAHLHGVLAQWAGAHARWVPICKTRVLTLKFCGPKFASLVHSHCTEIRRGLAQSGLTQSLSASAGFFEGCIQVVMRDHMEISRASPAESYVSWTSSGCTSQTDQDAGSCGGNPQPAFSSCAAQDSADIMRCAQAVPQEWLTSGTVYGFSDALGPFELVAENGVPVISPVQSTAEPVKVLSVEPACLNLGGGSTKVQLVCQLSPGDPIICMQDGQRLPIKILHVVRLDTPTGEVLHQVTVDLQPQSVGYVEFFAVAKAPIVPTRIMDANSCADAVFGAVGQDLAGGRELVGTLISLPAPLIVLDSAAACSDICSLVSPVGARRSSDSSTSFTSRDQCHASSSTDGNDSDDSCGSSKMHIAHNFQARVQGFPHYPMDNVSQGTHCMSMKFVKQFQQVAPTLTLCGVAKTYFRLCADSKPSSYQDRMELLVSQGISSAAEWQQLVGSCILFMARNGLQHATMHFLRQAAAYNSCGDISNLMHYAVASGSVDLVQNLVHEYGSAISNPSDYGATPLHLAAVIENPDMLLALVDHPGNADIAMTVRDMSGKTAYNYACEAGLQSNVRIIESSVRRHSPSSSHATCSN